VRDIFFLRYGNVNQKKTSFDTASAPH